MTDDLQELVELLFGTKNTVKVTWLLKRLSIYSHCLAVRD